MKDAIKKEAVKIVRSGGSHQLNFRDLGALVGVKSSSVHYYFPTKSDLLAEIVTDYSQAFMAALDQRTRNTKSLSKSLEVLVSLCEEAQNENLICLCGSLATEANDLDPKVTAGVSDFFSTLENWINGKIKLFDVESKISSAQLSKLVVSLIEGALIVDRAKENRQSLAAAKAWVKTF